MWKHLPICLLAAGLAACSGKAAPDATSSLAFAREAIADTEGQRYIQALVSAIDSADRIVVTEHSFDYDAYDVESQRSLLDQPVVYATKELSQEQVAAFRSSLSALDPATQDAFAACIFEPHHTVTFYRSGQPQSDMRICFECAQVEWEATSVAPPWSLYGGLREFVSSIGLQPDRDWRELAMERVKQR